MKCKRLLLMLLVALCAPWAAMGQQTLTVCDGGNTNSYVPLYSLYADYGTRSQFIIPAASLSDMAGGTIQNIKFYNGTSSISYDQEFTVYMMEVNYTTFASTTLVDWSSMTQVYQGTLAVSNNEMSIQLADPFAYRGQNLMIGIQVTSWGTVCPSASWQGENQTGRTALYNNANSSHTWSGTVTGVSFLPKTTFTYLTTDPYIALTPTSATVLTGFTQSLTANYGNVSGTPTITYTSSVTSVATVSGDGTTATVTGVAPGTATITATMNGSYTATCAITVEDPSYCTPNPSSVDGKGITALTFGSGSNVVNNSNSNGLPASSPYYGDYTSMVGSIEAGETATVTITYSTGTSTVYSYGTIIWVDWNKNYEFEDSEIVYTGTSAQGSGGTPQVLTATFTVPVAQAADNYRMRIAGADSYFDNYIGGNTSANHSPCFTSSYAVCHDYTLNVTAASPFQKPTDLEVSNITAYGATVAWQAPTTANPTGYEYQYSADDGTTWTTLTSTTGTSVNLTGLTPSTEYTFQVKANYTEGDSDFVQTTFTTVATCLVPEGLAVNDMVATWTAGTATQWNLQYKKTAGTEWTSVPSLTAATYDFNNLTLEANTNYDVQVQADCGNDDNSDWTATVSFRTPCGAISTFPWSENFESYATGDFNEPCWVNERIVDGTGTSGSLSVFKIYSGTQGTNSSKQLQLPDMKSGTQTKLVLPEMNIPSTGTYEFSIDVYRWASGTTSPQEGVRIFASTDGEIEGATELGFLYRNYEQTDGNIVTAETASGWYTYLFPLPQNTRFVILRGESYYGNASYMDNLVVKERITVTANQIVNTVSDPATEMTWEEFATHLNNGDHFTSSTFTLMDDITATTMAGTSDNPFTGIFEGSNHTITFNYTATDANFTAPFRIIRGATIQNLKVDGTINDGGFKFCAGFAGDCYGNNTFTNCVSDVTINATASGDGTHGGFIARNYGGSATGDNLCTTTFNGCAFTGQLLGSSTNQCGGFCGWSEYQSPNYAKTIFNNCLFAPTGLTMSTTSSATFARSRNATYVNFNNCYYTETFGTAQGKEMLYIIPDGNFPNITVEMVGTPTNYSLSGIDAYSPGIVYENVIYAGQDETVTLALGGSQTGYYKSIYGTLTPSGDNYTLRMAGYSTSIIELCPAPEGLAISNVTAHTATISWTVEEGVNYEYYISDNIGTPTYSSFTPVTSSPIQLDGLTAETEYYVYVIRKCYEGSHSQILAPTTFTTAISCPAPTQFAASDITNHTATLTWEGTSDSYTVQYRTVAGVNGSMLNENFNSLTTANSIPANWDNSEGTTTTESYKWCYNTSTSGNGATNGTSHDGSKCVRYNSYNASSGQTNFLKTPAMNFTAGETMVLSFWYKNPAGGDFSVYISTDGGTTKTALKEGMTYQTSWKQEIITLSDYVGASNVTIHFKATSNWGSGDAYIYLDDVKIGTEVAAGEWQNATVDGTTANLSGLIADRDYEATVQGDCGAVDGQSTVVSTTFTTDLPCPDPTNLQVVENSLKSERVTLSWDSDYAEEWTVAFKAEGDADFSEQTASENPFTLQDLTEETTYTVKVRSNCGSADGLSIGWSNEVTFTTTEACVVMDVAVGDVTHYAATVTWTGDNKDEDNPGFTVSYRTAQQIDGVEESFNTTSIPEDWTSYSGLLSNVMAGTSTLTTTTYGWYFGTKNTVFDSHAYLNIWSTSTNYWLVTPRTELPNGASCSFDLALTIWNGLTPVTAGNQADDKFVVLISTDNKETWTILRQWDNAGSDYVYDNITCSATGENVSLDLSSYAGQNVHIAFYGESTVSGGDNALHIDNVTIGIPVAAGEWQTMPAANDASSATISGLTAGKKYDVKVAPNCDATLESEIVQFTTVSPNEKWFVTEGNWSEATNWEPEGAPTISQNVTLKANATIESTCVAEAKSINGTGTSADNFTLTIKDGGKLKHLNSGVRATVEKVIRAYSTHYDADTYNNGDYYLIANPLMSAVTPSEANGFFAGKYDLYSWDYAQDLEWRNNVTSLTSGSYGYLYANEAGTTLTYTGTINAYTSYQNRYCSIASNPDSYNFPGWYLLGNPYMYDAYLASASSNGNALPYIKMNANGNGFENVSAGEPIPPMEGFFYQQATTSGNVYVVTSAPAVQSGSKLNMNLRRDNKQLDNAILVFGGDQKLGKMTFRANSSKIFMPVEGKDYAITSVEGQVGEVPVSFKAENNGTYSLSFTSEEVSFSYLHLIDNMTGNDVNLLQTPSYTFDARTTDYASRFKLVFAVGSSANDETFGFVNASGNFCIFGIEGEATVQVIDVLGHMLSSETFSGSYEKKIGGAPGVYMIRLIQGNDVKVQKVVVRR